ncbi:Ribonuclease P protein component 2 [Halorhabdus tiamatea SARL4B]|uniref:Ribonuclease P protein component 2 n=1 Tax=Halorhabdus tiamatea SARL4B TaxID=1033806 RepID=F7PIH8_9EURY|nr:Rpp14/Pop5 family protein [Halorhabdus tiamatea]ERJ07048.1 Ribonuclease P protein component 2 [Halorhabdus tiamatea SARL4B]CCQ34814.1 ribonuclease P protein component 2 [Halorhabdus tiamatea SARL4B]
MKHLPKHFRQRWRYLAVELETWPDADFDRGTFQRHLWFAAQNLLGDVGSASVGLSVLRFDRAGPTGTAIVRTRRDEVTNARAVLATLASVGDDPVGLRVRGVSGTVRACEETYLGGRPEARDQTVAFEGADRSAVARGGRVDVAVDDGFVGATNGDLH